MLVRVDANIIRDEGRYQPGQVVDLPDELAERWIKENLVVALSAPAAAAAAPVETATTEGAPETAVGTRQRGARKN